MIYNNLKTVEQNIEKACKRSGRSRDEITLIAVSKTKPVSMLQEAYNLGIHYFGENKVQEIIDKYDQLNTDIRWQMIGHLQRNKVKYIVDKVDLIHSVDSLRLAEQINEEAIKQGVIVKVLIQVNIANEDTKFGVLEEEVLPLVKAVAKLSNVQINGLMTIAPFVENAEENRTHFRNLHKLLIDIKSKNIDNIHMDILSMGMTGDYEVAIEEGATMVRVGTGIFGERNYINQ